MVATGAGQIMAESFSVEKQWRAHSMIRLLDLSEREILDFSQGKMADSILECQKGEYLPLRIILKGEFLSLEQDSATPLSLRVLKSCYIRCEEKERFLFSADLRTSLHGWNHLDSSSFQVS